ncbi:hypothetical protein TBR22_A41620 [Luteitalea sp. TBR-22]|uniref:hypothetical protein n=1 Tax=Luteitalea sp. TBR-22 TaxID=2802971 RepID=UPI001AF531C7|nr:hypothetical protein [Luteitalea sp. TBR-22]BCS34936.1 hypothetical protein TBR22_A41620 [Luteitalea sp. TBR-22]
MSFSLRFRFVAQLGAAFLMALGVVQGTSAQQPLGTAFTYQGRLTDAGAPATGSYDFEMRLFGSPTEGVQVGPTLTLDDVAVAAGAFTVQLDFGSAPFGTDRRWLQMAVRPGASTGTFTPLTPRQELTPTPTALVATRANTVAAGAVGAAAIDPATVQARITGQCAAGSSIRQVNADGSVVCQSDLVGGGTVSAVTAGAGLTGGTITTAGTIGIAPGGITGAMVASGAIGLAQIDASQVQARVAASCANGTFLRAIAANGTPDCAALPTPPKTGVVIAAEGRVATIARNDGTATWVAQAGPNSWRPSVKRCLNTPCQGVVSGFTAISGGPSGTPQHFSLAMTQSGLPMVAYSTFLSSTPLESTLVLERCFEPTCTGIEGDVIRSSPSNRVGLFSALVSGADGLPVVLYSLHNGNIPLAFEGLRLGRCTNNTCNAFTTTSITPVGVARPEFALVISGGVPVGVFIDGMEVRAFSCAAADCASLVTSDVTFEERSARFPSMAVGANGRPVVAFGSDGGLKLARCRDAVCNRSDAPVVLDATATGPEVTSAVAVTADGRPVIAYLKDFTINLISCGNATCTSGNVQTTIDAARTDTSDLLSFQLEGLALPSRPGLVLNGSLPVVTYPDMATGHVKTASCTTDTCR